MIISFKLCAVSFLPPKLANLKTYRVRVSYILPSTSMFWMSDWPKIVTIQPESRWSFAHDGGVRRIWNIVSTEDNWRVQKY